MVTFDACAFLVPVQAQGYCGVTAVSPPRKLSTFFRGQWLFSRVGVPQPSGGHDPLCHFKVQFALPATRNRKKPNGA